MDALPGSLRPGRAVTFLICVLGGGTFRLPRETVWLAWLGLDEPAPGAQPTGGATLLRIRCPVESRSLPTGHVPESKSEQIAKASPPGVQVASNAVRAYNPWYRASFGLRSVRCSMPAPETLDFPRPRPGFFRKGSP